MRVLVYAYLKDNFGDDLLAYIMCKQYPNYDFYFMCNRDYGKTRGLPSNFHVLPNLDESDFMACVMDKVAERMGVCRPSIRRLAQSFEYDCYLILGGSMFIESSRHHTLNAVSEHRLLAHKAETSILIDGNFGPYRSASYYELFESLFSEFTAISFRESYSYELFSHLDNVSWGSDLVFSLNSPNQRTEAEPEEIVVFPIKVESREGLSTFADAYYGSIVEYIGTRERYPLVKLVSLCEYEGDLSACEVIGQRLRSRGIEASIVKYGRIDEIVDTVCGATRVIASRFHGIFLAAALEVPVCPLSYSNKIDNCFRDLNLPKASIRIEDLGKREAISESDFILLDDERKCESQSCRRHFSIFESSLEKQKFYW